MANKLPDIGTLVRLKPWHGQGHTIRVEAIEPDHEGLWQDREFDADAVALVVGHIDRENESRNRMVPLVMVDGWVGWIFNDEWRPI